MITYGSTVLWYCGTDIHVHVPYRTQIVRRTLLVELVHWVPSSTSRLHVPGVLVFWAFGHATTSWELRVGHGKSIPCKASICTCIRLLRRRVRGVLVLKKIPYSASDSPNACGDAGRIT